MDLACRAISTYPSGERSLLWGSCAKSLFFYFCVCIIVCLLILKYLNILSVYFSTNGFECLAWYYLYYVTNITTFFRYTQDSNATPNSRYYGRAVTQFYLYGNWTSKTFSIMVLQVRKLTILHWPIVFIIIFLFCIMLFIFWTLFCSLRCRFGWVLFKRMRLHESFNCHAFVMTDNKKVCVLFLKKGHYVLTLFSPIIWLSSDIFVVSFYLFSFTIFGYTFTAVE